MEQALAILKKTERRRSKVYKNCLEQYERAQKILEQTSAEMDQKDRIRSDLLSSDLLAELPHADPFIKEETKAAAQTSRSVRSTMLFNFGNNQRIREHVGPAAAAAEELALESIKFQGVPL